MEAAGYYHTSLLAALSFAGANVNATDKDGRGPFHILVPRLASECNSPRYLHRTTHILAILLDAGCDPRRVDDAGKTPTQYLERDSEAWKIWSSLLKDVCCNVKKIDTRSAREERTVSPDDNSQPVD